MQDVRILLHPTDFSSTAETALRVAIRMAYQLEADLKVIHVMRSRSEKGRIEPRMPQVGDVETRLHRAVDAALANLSAGADDRIAIEYDVVSDMSAADGILRAAEKGGVDVIVMGTHGRRGFRRYLLGSVAARVLHEATCDVLVVPDKAATELAGRILIPVDLFGRSPDVVAVAARLAERFQSGIDLLYVIDTSLLFVPSLEDRIPARIDTIQEVAIDRLRELAGNVKTDVEMIEHTADGHPAREIVAFAETHGNALIVLASSGMTPDERQLLEPTSDAVASEQQWMLGGITERVVTHAKVPVWVRKKFDNAWRAAPVDVHALEYSAS